MAELRNFDCLRIALPKKIKSFETINAQLDKIAIGTFCPDPSLRVTFVLGISSNPSPNVLIGFMVWGDGKIKTDTR